MEANSWQGDPVAAAMEASSVDWRTQLQPEARQRVVNKIMETLKKHLPISVPEGLNELQKIAIRFEEKIYTAAVSQSDYLRKISLKMLSMESKTQQNAPINPSMTNASLGMQSQINNQAQSLSLPMVNQTSTRQQMFPQNIQNNNSAAVESSANNFSSLSSFKTLNQSTVSTASQNMSGMAQSTASNSMVQTTTPDIYANAQRQMQGRQQQQPMISQQQQQSQNQLLYQHQLQVQQQLLKQQKLQQSSVLQSHIPQQQQQQQQQQQSLMQTTQLQPSQQSLMQMQPSLQSAQSSIPPAQPGTVQSSAQSGLRQNQLSSVQQSVPSLLQQHPQSVARPQQQPQPTLHQQASTLQQQPASVTQQSSLSLQQHQPQLIGSQTSVSNIQQTQLLGQQTSVTEMQQQPQRMPVQQNTLLNMQQSQQMLNQQNISLHQKQLGSQNNSMPGMGQHQQQQIHGSLSGVSNMQPQQRPMHMLQHSKLTAQQQQQYQHQHQQQPPQQHQNQQTVAALQSQNQQSQHQQSQQLVSQIQSQPAHLQQHLTMQQQPNNLQREIQQRFQPSGTLLSQNAIEQQKQFVQSQRTLPDVSSSVDSTSGHPASVDWQEEIYQKIKSLKELYLADLNELFQRIVMKLQQHETLMPAVRQTDQYEKMKSYKLMLECILKILQLPKGSIQPLMKDKLPLYEKQIISFLAPNKKKVIPSQPSGQQLQHSGSHIQSLAQQQPGQLGQLQQHENHANQMQQMNLQGSAASMQPAPLANSQHGSMSLSTQFSASTTQQTLPNSLQSGTTLDQAQGNSFSSLQQGPIGSMQQNMASGQSTVNVPQQNNVTNLSHNSMSTLQTNSMQPNSSILQQQNMKQQPEQQQQQQHMMQTQQIKHQFQQRQMQQQMIQQKQQFLQAQQPVQQQKQQSSAQMPIQQMTQLHQSTEPSELKVRQTSGIKPGLYPQHYSASQRQQFKTSAAFPISSPQNLQALSPQISHNSPQIDQQSLLPSQIKSGTPLQSANSPFVPSPSTSFAPSPIPGESEKPLSVISSLSSAGHVGIQQPPVAPSQVQQLSVATPGMSASPLLQEFTSADGNQSNMPTAAASKTGATENPLDRIIKMVESSKANVLSSAISDIGSVVSMVDRIAGSAPVNGSRGAVGEDLVAMTKCRLQARNFMTQDGNTTAKKMKRDTSAMPLNNVLSGGSVSDNFKQSCGLRTSELESTATSRAKQRKTEVNHALLEEIKEINQRLIGTVVTISEEDDDSIAAASEGEGTVVKCSFTPVALSPSLKSQFASAQMSPILPLRLLVSANYPKCSPVLLDKLPDDLSTESDDLSVKAKARFSISLRSLSQPVSLGEMARTWEACAHKVIAEYAQQIGGGCFSSRYGAWENCVGA